MCTVIKASQQNCPKTAKKDIEVYKRGRVYRAGDVKYFISQYYGFMYKSDEIQHLVFTYSNYDSCSDTTEAEYYIDLCNEGIKTAFVNVGFHAYISVDRIVKEYKDSNNVALFIIPKGAKYYENRAGNIVSNQIIFKHFI